MAKTTDTGGFFNGVATIHEQLGGSGGSANYAGIQYAADGTEVDENWQDIVTIYESMTDTQGISVSGGFYGIPSDLADDPTLYLELEVIDTTNNSSLGKTKGSLYWLARKSNGMNLSLQCINANGQAIDIVIVLRTKTAGSTEKIKVNDSDGNQAWADYIIYEQTLGSLGGLG